MQNYEEKMQVLRMLEEGKISHVEAMELLEAVGDQPAAEQVYQTDAGDARKMLRIRVIENDKPKVRVNIPLKLAKAGLSLAKGIKNSDGRDVLSTIDSEQIMALIEGDVEGELIEVDDIESGEVVKIYIE